jgi:hypothetical protein
MGQLEKALRRLDGAVTRLEATIGDAAGGAAMPAAMAEEVAALGAERDRLTDEVGRLRAQAAEDARLRAEAARAVRSALHDLRGAVSPGLASGNGPGNGQGDG